MFQVIAARAEKAAVIVTTNLPFSEWPQVIPNPRLFKALIDPLTGRAHIIPPGPDSHRFPRPAAQRKTPKSRGEPQNNPPDRPARAGARAGRSAAAGGPEFASTGRPI